ncbi:diguanylate cyclase [Vibrio sp. ZSDZ34]|uniref:Diguanylate cyclase n=1 Tax=Vibrio gelatinilyticus TaxID=2893468 RepID=A0A9X1WAW3_9VIBR|nr:sensor domain-containing diguanylate cyclase [Vibrio gelatinilyticus]MCJ2377497.1 diguanylate cyclase [Vibrio gelatinilyticus]
MNIKSIELLDSSIYRLFEITPVATILSFPDGHLEYVNPALKKLLGYEGESIYDSDVVITYHGDLEANKKLRESLLAFPSNPIQIEKRYLHRLGHVINAQLNMVAQLDDSGKVIRYISQIIDLTSLRKAEAADLMLNHFVDKTNDALYVADFESGQIVNSNQLAYTRLGYSKEELLKLRVSDINEKFTDDNSWTKHANTIRLKKSAFIEGFHCRKDGSKFPIEASVNFIKYKEREYLVAIVRDISQRHDKMQLEIDRLNRDPLTDLPNRRLLDSLLQSLLTEAERENHTVAFMYIDIDKFKQINDEHGHLVGDAILVEMAHRLLNSVRKPDIVARLGGDEFLIVVGGIKNSTHVEVVANKVAKKFFQPFKIDDQVIDVDVSIGITTYQRSNMDIRTSIGRADKAMYVAKKRQGTAINHV